MPYTMKKHGRNLEDEMRNRLGYWKLVKKTMEAHETKAKSILFRKNLLDAQKKINYQNEYERLRGTLAHTVIPIQTRETLTKRKNQLAKLGAKALPE